MHALVAVIVLTINIISEKNCCLALYFLSKVCCDATSHGQKMIFSEKTVDSRCICGDISDVKRSNK